MPKLQGETLFGIIELVGYRDSSGQIKIPRRPLNPGEKVYGVDYEFLSGFYKFDENKSIHIGNLIGYDKGENIVPVYLDVNKLVTEHLAVLAMTGSGKSYTVGRIIERLVALMNGTVVVFDVAIRYWQAKYSNPPRDIQDLREILSGDLEELREWEELSPAEARALNGRSAAVAATKLNRVINEAKSFYTRAIGEPSDIYDMVGEKGDNIGRLVIIDLQGLSDDAKQIITALISSEIMRAAGDKRRQTRPCFLVYEEGHNFAPAGIPSISKKIIKRIASEGRKFGVGFSIISQRPSKLDPDVTSQCNTIITMRLKNPDDQRFIAKTSDMFSKADIDELPSLSTGEALINGRSIPAPLLVKVGTKALIHEGESPEVTNEWGVFNG